MMVLERLKMDAGMLDPLSTLVGESISGLAVGSTSTSTSTLQQASPKYGPTIVHLGFKSRRWACIYRHVATVFLGQQSLTVLEQCSRAGAVRCPAAPTAAVQEGVLPAQLRLPRLHLSSRPCQ